MPSKKDFGSFSYRELQNLAKWKGIPATGGRDVIVARLVNAELKRVGKETSGDKMSAAAPTKSSESANKLNVACELDIPSFWGSSVERISDDGSDINLGDPRHLTIAMITEPYVISLARKAGVPAVITRSAVAELKLVLKQEIARVCAALPEDSGDDVQAAVKASRSLGVNMLGVGGISAPEGNGPLHAALIASKGKINPKNMWRKHWSVFCRGLEAPSVDTCAMYTMLKMYKLVESKRAFCCEEVSVLNIACSKLDTTLFRHVLSFLRGGLDKSMRCKTIELFTDDKDLMDNWDSSVCGTVDEALAEGVNVVTARDGHTGVSRLHYAAANDLTEDCQRLIDMGIEVDEENGSGFENGDGWGELEYLSFTPLHFACSNGFVETARVLLRNGADPTHTAGWDGGYETPFTISGDYWYTNNNTPLHQAARGNHVGIIDLLLNGPDKESLAYAAGKGVDITSTWGAMRVDCKSASADFYDDEGNEERENMTPLGFALMFGNLDAALALIRHGAKLSEVAGVTGRSREFIMTALVKKGSKIAAYVRQNLERSGGSDWEALSRAVTGEEGEEEEEEDPWDKDDWDEKQVPPGDAKVLPLDHDPEDNDYDAQALPTEECLFAEELVRILTEVTGNMHMSRIAQLLMSDLACCFVDRVVEVCGGPAALTFDAVMAAVPALLPGLLVKFGKSELEKDKIKNMSDADVTGALAAYLAYAHPGVPAGSGGVKACYALLDYVLAEIIEVSSNQCRNSRLNCIHPWHIALAMGEDEELMKLAVPYCFGNVGNAAAVCVFNPSSINKLGNFFSARGAILPNGQNKWDDFHGQVS
jgi:hypothetical protein